MALLGYIKSVSSIVIKCVESFVKIAISIIIEERRKCRRYIR